MSKTDGFLVRRRPVSSRVWTEEWFEFLEDAITYARESRVLKTYYLGSVREYEIEVLEVHSMKIEF